MCYDLKHTVLQATTFHILIAHLKDRIYTFTYTLPRNWTFISVASWRWSVFGDVLRTISPDFRHLPKLVFHNCPRILSNTKNLIFVQITCSCPSVQGSVLLDSLFTVVWALIWNTERD